MAKQKRGLTVINQIAIWLTAIGALNWLLVSLMNFNLVETLLGNPTFAGLKTLVYSLIGASGGWIGIQALMGKVKVE